MSDSPQIGDVLAYVDARERELGKQAGQLRSSIEELTARLGELDAESENLCVTRKTLLAIRRLEPVEETPCLDVPDHPAYQQILTDAGRPMRAHSLCEAFDPPILPKNTEGMHQAVVQQSAQIEHSGPERE
ncbi:hypothetical protein [Streptomyces sp. WM6378]|uniref:hypothetical protein n=1 Tax=Streptomyces sp. WM6378 TaxID=1415557 RepID=UPI0006AF6B64|nr:hypothetical protein [Streptomyces sp. WM6378]